MENDGGTDVDLPRKKVGWEGKRRGRRLPDVKVDIAESNDEIVHDRSMRIKDWV